MRRNAWLLIGLLWATTVVGGFGALLRYKGTAGDGGAPPATWPPPARLALDGDRPTLLLFVHPRCPCSRASVAELGRLLQRVRGRVAATVVFIRPPDAAPDFSHTDLRT